MRSTIDFSPYRPSWIGFDHLFDMLENSRQAETDSFPPFDLEQEDENTYRLRLAVAGFGQEDIEITSKSNLLVVAGKREDEPQRNYLYRGISARAFERQFQLADYMVVAGAQMSDGLLEIELKRELPEAVKPRKIEIATQPQLKKVESPSRRRARTENREKVGQNDNTEVHNETRKPSAASKRKEPALSGAW